MDKFGGKSLWNNDLYTPLGWPAALGNVAGAGGSISTEPDYPAEIFPGEYSSLPLPRFSNQKSAESGNLSQEVFQRYRRRVALSYYTGKCQQVIVNDAATRQRWERTGERPGC